MKLGEKLKIIRKQKELTQPELALSAGIEQSYLSKVENDKVIPSFDIMNRISMPLDLSVFELIGSLNQTYVRDNLSHIPEIAVEYSKLKQKQEVSIKKKFLLAAFFVVIGVSLTLVGITDLIYPEKGYVYMSRGVILKNEPIDQFSRSPMTSFGETIEDVKVRLISNEGRSEKIFYKTYTSHGNQFIKDVDGGKRLFHLNSHIEGDRFQNDLIVVLGVMLLTTGLFVFIFIVRFKPE